MSSLIRKTFIYDIGLWLFKNRPFYSDEKQIRTIYKKRFNTEINLENPVNFNEKNNWRKLYDRNPIYTKMADKYEIKSIVKEKCGENHAFKIIGVWQNANEIDFDSLPNQFVLKNNHSDGIIVCKDKAKFNYLEAIKELNKGLKENKFLSNREWPYKDIPRKIIAEEYMGDNLVDFKNYCFNGKMMYTFVWKNVSRENGRKPQAYFCGGYDRNWVKTDIKVGYPTLDDEVIDKPKYYDQIVEIAEKLSKDIPFVRVDTYVINDNVYVGEMTFFPWGGFMKLDEKTNRMLGDLENIQVIK